MKNPLSFARILVALVFVVFASQALHAQVPQAIAFQGVAIDQNGQPVPGLDQTGTPIRSTPIMVRFGILDATPAGALLYEEDHAVQTDAYGRFSTEIGRGTVRNGSFSNIDWTAGKRFLRVSVDLTGSGNNFTLSSVQEFLSVPYALAAERVRFNDDADADPTNELQGLTLTNDTLLSISGRNTVRIPTSVGPQGPVGPQGLTGPQGATGPQGPAGPQGVQGLTGPQGLTGGAGPQGQTGAQGAQGTAGSNGKTILSGTSAPSTSIGTLGDFYINTSNNTLFGPKTSTTWGTGTSLIGPQGATGPQGASGAQGLTGATGPQGPAGPQGAQGTAGTNGKTILSGTSAPSTSIGALGDFYINTSNNTLFGPKTSTSWGTGTSLIGPQGPTGPQGSPGAQGLTGATGPQGPTGPQGAQGTAGTNGKTILSGTSAPSTSIGTVGDFYINTSNNTLFGPKTSTTWGTGTSLIGPQGATGPQGPVGATGTFQSGNNIGDITYWNGTSWTILPAGAHGQTLSACNGIPTWGPCIMPSSNGTAIISSINSCTTASSGSFIIGVPANGQSQTINVSVSSIGTYNISAIANGITFNASGSFTNTGAQNIVLLATGTPTNSGSPNFTINTTPNCSFSRTISTNSTSNGSANITSINSCTTASNGTLTLGAAASGVTQTINVTVGTPGTYNLSATANGITYSAVGTFTNVGSQNVVLTASGTPSVSGTSTYTINTTPNCSFTATVAAPFTVNAGPDQINVDGQYSGCGATGKGFMKVNLIGSAIPSGGTALWTVIANNSTYPAPNFCVAPATTSTIEFKGKPGDQYTLQYAVTKNGVTITDQVTVRFNPCKTYVVTKVGSSPHFFQYRTCATDLASNPTYIGNNGATISVCAFPGSISTANPTSFSISAPVGNCTN